MFKRAFSISGDGCVCLSIVASGFVVLVDAYKQGWRHMLLTKHCSSAAYECDQLHDSSFIPVLSKDDVRDLEKNGFIVLDNVLSNTQITQINKDLTHFTQTLEDFPNSTSVKRNDIIRYLNHTDRDNSKSIGKGLGLLHAQNIIRGLGHVLISNQFAGFHGITLDVIKFQEMLSVPDVVQLSLYQGLTSAACEAHRDGISLSFLELGILQYLKLRAQRMRCVTAILYLNDEYTHESTNTSENENAKLWCRDADGGCLRLHIGAHARDNTGITATNVIDIEPRGGRLVIFDSKVMLHEVMATKRDRFAISIFFTM